MKLNNTTPTPNNLFDIHLKSLSHKELLVLMVIIRQTWGWTIAKGTRQRRKRARILQSHFAIQTGLSRKTIYTAINSLLLKGLIQITDFNNNKIPKPKDRQGKSYLFYSYINRDKPVYPVTQASVNCYPLLVYPVTDNKRKKKNDKEIMLLDLKKNSSSAFNRCKEFVHQLKYGVYEDER